MVTLYPADFKSLPREAAVIPFPSQETTHQVTKINFIHDFYRNKTSEFYHTFFLAKNKH